MLYTQMLPSSSTQSSWYHVHSTKGNTHTLSDAKYSLRSYNAFRHCIHSVANPSLSSLIHSFRWYKHLFCFNLYIQMSLTFERSHSDDTYAYYLKCCSHSVKWNIPCLRLNPCLEVATPSQIRIHLLKCTLHIT